MTAQKQDSAQLEEEGRKYISSQWWGSMKIHTKPFKTLLTLQ